MKKSLFSLLAVVAMVSCTQSDVIEVVSNEDVEIKVASSAIAAETMTRAPFEGTLSNSNSLDARVLVSETSGSYTTTYANDKMIFGDNAGITPVGFATPKYYPADNRTLYMCGLYPFDNWNTPANNECKLTFDGSQDVMAAPEKSSSKDASKGGTYPQLDFKHLLTQLVIKTIAADADAITVWGDLTDITLAKVGANNPSGTITVDLKNGSADEDAAFAGPLVAGMPFWVRSATPEVKFTGQTKALTVAGEEVAYAMVAPLKNATGTGDYTLTVKTVNSGSTAVTVPVNLKKTAGTAYTGTTQGKKFVVTLTFKGTKIEALATVEDWTEDGNSDAEIQ